MKKSQIEFIGKGKVAELSNVLSPCLGKNIFLVTGKKSYEACGANEDIDVLLSGYKVISFNAYSPNPTYDEALEGATIYAENNCDFIIAVGGGSAMDVAKTINVLQAHKGSEYGVVTGKIKVCNTLAPMCVVPTTAGTGSEATHFAVIYVDGKKYSLADQTIMPDYVVLDASYSAGLSPYITACTGFDALAQAIESFWAKGATKESRGFATKAIKLLVDAIELAVNISEISAREKMLLGANLAGKAINISKTTAPHALSYAITTKAGLPHGFAVALTLGNFFLINGRYDAGNEKMAKLYTLIGVRTPEEACRWWYGLMAKCGLKPDMALYGIDNPEAIAALIGAVNIERLDNHPFSLDEGDLQQAFKPFSPYSLQ